MSKWLIGCFEPLGASGLAKAAGHADAMTVLIPLALVVLAPLNRAEHFWH
jgi:hypothetical protein